MGKIYRTKKWKRLNKKRIDLVLNHFNDPSDLVDRKLRKYERLTSAMENRSSDMNKRGKLFKAFSRRLIDEMRKDPVIALAMYTPMSLAYSRARIEDLKPLAIENKY